MKKYIFLTTMELGWQKQWVILLDKDNNSTPIESLADAKNYVRIHLKHMYCGLATYEQMKLNNAMWDNM